MDALASAHGLHLCSSPRPGRNTAEKNAEAIL
jgi:hypothetical protein